LETTSTGNGPGEKQRTIANGRLLECQIQCGAAAGLVLVWNLN